MNSSSPALGPVVRLSADERFHRSYSSILWAGMIVSTLIHFAFFYGTPVFRTRTVTSTVSAVKTIELPPEVKIPPPPEAIARPAVPVAAPTGDIDQDITIAPTTFQQNPVSELPPPPTEEGQRELSETPTFTPYTVKPSIKNRSEVAQALQKEYPQLLRDAGIGGTVLVWFFIDTHGKVENTQIKQSSGHEALDNAALKVADVFQFTPALNRDKKVPVWIALPIIFQVSS